MSSPQSSDRPSGNDDESLFTTAASGTEQRSLDELRTATDTSYFKDKDALWVKMVSNGNGARGPIGGGPGGGTSLQVSR